MTPTTSPRHWTLVATLLLAGALPSACEGGDENECAAGMMGCACTPQGLCFNGLTCLSNFCVDPGGTSGKTTSTSTSGEPETSGEPTTGGSSESVGTEPGGPEFVQFLTNVTELTEGESIVFTAIVTDPDGAADVVGGTLTSPDGQIAYGAFVSTGQPGSFEFVLPWAMIDQAQTIEFETPSAVRTFRAEFFDQSSKSAWKTVDITLTCDDGVRFTPAACGGVCTDLNADDAHCAGCGRACEVRYGEGHCESSACTPVMTGCIKFDDYPTCYAYCLDQGESCVVGGCDGDTSIEIYACDDDSVANYKYDHACGDDIGNFHFTRCCCTQNDP